MNIIEMLKQGLLTVLLLSSLPMVTAVVVGIAVSLIQSVMQLQDATLPFMLKLVSTAITLIFTGQWILQEVMQFSINCFNVIGQIRA